MPPRRSFLMRHVRMRELDPETEAHYLRVWTAGDLYNRPELFPPITSEALFGNDNPLELEIGCSTGEYLCSLAQAWPEHNFLGIEVNLKALKVAAMHAASLGLENVQFVKAPAQDTYRLIPPHSLHAIYMHFPDPALHPKYRKRRLINRHFLGQMHRALVPGGILSLVTDKEELFWEVLALVEADPRFERTHLERFLVGFEPTVKSRYQQYWERHGCVIRRLELRSLPGGEGVLEIST